MNSWTWADDRLFSSPGTHTFHKPKLYHHSNRTHTLYYIMCHASWVYTSPLKNPFQLFLHSSLHHPSNFSSDCFQKYLHSFLEYHQHVWHNSTSFITLATLGAPEPLYVTQQDQTSKEEYSLLSELHFNSILSKSAITSLKPSQQTWSQECLVGGTLPANTAHNWHCA